MLSKPTSSDLIEGVIMSLQNDILPDVGSERGQVLVVMMQGVLQNVRQRIEVEQQYMAEEHNQVVALFRKVAQTLGETPGADADRIRQRAATLGARPSMPELPAFADLNSAYRDVSEGLVETVRDLDALIRSGNPAAELALTAVRAYLGERSVREFAVTVVGAGMVGRG